MEFLTINANNAITHIWGVSVEIWGDILIALISAAVGGFFTFLVQRKLKIHEENVKLSSQITQKRIEKIEQLQKFINDLDRCTMICNEEYISFFKESYPEYFLQEPLLSRNIFQTYDTFLDFSRKVETFYNGEAVLYLDTKSSTIMKCLIGYISEIKGYITSIRLDLQKNINEDELKEILDFIIFEIGILTCEEINKMTQSFSSQLQEKINTISIKKYPRKNRRIKIEKDTAQDFLSEYPIVFMLKYLLLNRVEEFKNSNET